MKQFELIFPTIKIQRGFVFNCPIIFVRLRAVWWLEWVEMSGSQESWGELYEIMQQGLLITVQRVGRLCTLPLYGIFMTTIL